MLSNTEPPGIVRQTEAPRQQALRDSAIALAVKASTSSLDLGWTLGEIRSQETYRSWLNTANGLPFLSFSAWLDSDIAPHVARSTAYELSTIGVWMKAARKDVERLVAEKRVGVTRLVKLAALIERNKVALADALDAVETGAVLDAERRGEADPEQFVKLPITIPRGDAPSVRKGLLYHAIRAGHSTLDQAVMDLAISEAQDTTLPRFAERWLDLIEADAFYCAACGRIPLQPTEHHLIPQSIAQGEGPTALLDLECHRAIQSKWKSFGELHLGKRRFNELLAKYKSRNGNNSDGCGCVNEQGQPDSNVTNPDV